MTVQQQQQHGEQHRPSSIVHPVRFNPTPGLQFPPTCNCRNNCDRKIGFLNPCERESNMKSDGDGASKRSSSSSGGGGLPSGLAAMMKEMDDCDRPACEDTLSALTAALGRVKTKQSSAEGSAKGSGDPSPPVACPPTSGLLGKSSWNLVHSMAAWYPNNPSTEDERMMTQFMEAFARFYPCTYCAKDFQDNLAKSPVKAKSREDLCMWLCGQHNLVNKKLGKDLFKCDMKTLDERWRKSSDPNCQT